MMVISVITIQNVGATNHGYPAHPPPKLTPSENQTIIDTALSVPGLQNWSHGWQYVLMGFGSNNELGTPYFRWQYASVVLRAPSSSAPVSCNNDWWATIVIDMTTMKVVNATYPTLESHSCQVTTGGGPESIGLESSGNTTSIESPLKQFKSGIQAQNIQCEAGDELILKSQDGSPACVKPMTAKILIERGWGHCPLRLGFVNCP